MRFPRRRRNRSTATYAEFSDPVRQLLAEVFAARAAFPIQPEELPAIVAVRTLIADTVAMCPLIELGPDGEPVRNPSPIVSQPDPFEFGWLTHHRTVMALTGDGNAWLMPTSRNPLTGRAVSVMVLDPTTVTPLEDARTRRVTGCHWDGRDLSIDRGEVIHIPMNVTGRRGQLGESALRMSRPAMEAVSELFKFVRSTWAEFGAPSVKLKVPHRIDDTPDPETGTTESDRLRAGWLDTHGGKRVPAVLSGGADVEAFGAVDDHSKLAEALEIISAEAPRAYRVPPSLVNARSAGTAMDYTNVGAEMTRWLRTGLRSYFMRLEAAYSLMVAPGNRAAFDTSELEKGDGAALMSLFAAYLSACGEPFLTVDEVRALDRRGPMPARPAAADPIALGNDPAPPTAEGAADQPLTRSRALTLVAPSPEASTTPGLLVPWDSPKFVTDDGSTFYREAHARGSLLIAPDQTIPVFDGHTPTGERGPQVGEVVEVSDRPDGLHGRIVMYSGRPQPEAGTGLSIEFEELETVTTPDGVALRTRSQLVGLALTSTPQYDIARIHPNS